MNEQDFTLELAQDGAYTASYSPLVDHPDPASAVSDLLNGAGNVESILFPSCP